MCCGTASWPKPVAHCLQRANLVGSLTTDCVRSAYIWTILVHAHVVGSFPSTSATLHFITFSIAALALHMPAAGPHCCDRISCRMHGRIRSTLFRKWPRSGRAGLNLA